MSIHKIWCDWQFNSSNSCVLVRREQQSVYVGGNKKENGEEVDVYDQGMWKTELCNKWEETGSCPYGDNCQFAHGIKQLRPVIRHPRYKTQVCRMMLSGDNCPYAHRCHFRHTLTDHDRLMAVSPPPPRWLIHDVVEFIKSTVYELLIGIFKLFSFSSYSWCIKSRWRCCCAIFCHSFSREIP